MPRKYDLDSLRKYREMRSGDATPEPFGGEVGDAESRKVGGLFVVQKHAATRLHYDLRLEHCGVLKSWAVPKGFSLDPEEKRFAAETEDHPFEYGDFEGVIPEGNYGAGAMIVWDRGRWIPLEDPFEGWEKGKLLFELRGYKLHGVWTIFRIKPPVAQRGKSRDEDKSWLLMKKPDGAARKGGEYFPETSVISGLTVEELASGSTRMEAVLESAKELGAPKKKVSPQKVKPMLATLDDEPRSRKGWIYELKYDGYRLIAAKVDGKPYLRYRNGHDATALFPEIARALERWPVDDLVLDGEVVVLDAEGHPSFNRLQRRAMLTKTVDIERATLEHPATLFAFDMLSFCGYDLRALKTVERKGLLQEVVPPAGPLRFCDHIEERGKELFAHIGGMGLEGMVAKDGAAAYVGRRSTDWLKYRYEQTGDFVIVGMTLPEKGKNRTGFGALHLAIQAPENAGEEELDLIYAGRVGTGFDEHKLRTLSEQLRALERPDPPCRAAPDTELPATGKHLWAEPELVCEVRYKEWTHLHMLRHPVYLHLRPDKPPFEATGRGRSRAHAAGDDEPPAPQVEAPERPKPTFSNLDKIFWPEDGYTKGDMIEFYRQAAPTMLRYLEDRPVVLTRYPDGIHGKSFFQKNAPDFAPDWVHTETISSGGGERDIEYFVVNDEETLLYLANLGAIVLHVWSSRLTTLDRPDWCILDLDPKEAPFTDVVKLAKAIKKVCDEIGLPSYAKTSGSSGIHVLLPLGGAFDYQQSRTLAQLLATVIAQQHDDIATVIRNPAKRDGRVYVDYVQNGRGRLLVAPFSVRPKLQAPVSTPLRWREVTNKLTIEQWNIRSVPKRLKRQKSDPLAGVLEDEPDLLAALEKLAEML